MQQSGLDAHGAHLEARIQPRLRVELITAEQRSQRDAPFLRRHPLLQARRQVRVLGQRIESAAENLVEVRLTVPRIPNDHRASREIAPALREVGFLLRAAVRETDYPVRYGGDEFVIILPQTTTAAAVLLAEKLRALIEKHVFLQEEEINARIGVSLGVSTYPEDARDKESLLRLADQRMYADKELRKTR